MHSYRKTGIIVGILLIACTATTIVSLSLLKPILDDPEYLIRLTQNASLVLAAAIFEFIWAATAMAIAIWLYPIIRKHNEALSLGSVGFRVVEGVFVFVSTLGLLSLLSLSQAFIRAGGPDASYFQTMGTILLAARHYANDGIVLIRRAGSRNR